MKGGISLTGKIVPIFNPTRWQKKAFSARKYVTPSNSEASLKARIALAETATRNYGSSGTVGGIPVVAAKVRAENSGKSYGGKSVKERREEKHAMAAGSIAALKAKLASK